jgi:hypothetical protein
MKKIGKHKQDIRKNICQCIHYRKMIIYKYSSTNTMSQSAFGRCELNEIYLNINIKQMIENIPD